MEPLDPEDVTKGRGGGNPTVTPGRTLTARERRQREQAAVTHGLRVKSLNGRRLRDRRTRRLLEKVRAAMPWLQPSDLPAARAWSQLEVLSTQAFAHLARRLDEGLDELPERALDAYRKLRQTQLAFATSLGMTPAARASLGLTVRKTETLAEYVAAKYGARDGAEAIDDHRSARLVQADDHHDHCGRDDQPDDK